MATAAVGFIQLAARIDIRLRIAVLLRKTYGSQRQNRS
jgi:hypothetical protein